VKNEGQAEQEIRDPSSEEINETGENESDER
jgi:hypothetical protein